LQEGFGAVVRADVGVRLYGLGDMLGVTVCYGGDGVAGGLKSGGQDGAPVAVSDDSDIHGSSFLGGMP
jgi:hypothetical protein